MITDSEVKKQREQAAFSTVGHTGLNRMRGHIGEEWLPRLQGPRGMAFYREMGDNEPIVGAYLFGLSMFVQQADWKVRGADDSPEAAEIRDFIDQVIFEDMALPFNSVLTEILTMAQFGWAALEVLWKERRGPGASFPHTSKFNDELIGVHKLSPRSQDSLLEWVYDEETGELVGLKQKGLEDTPTIPLEKVLHFRTMSIKENPEGFSLLRRATKPYYHKKKLEIIEAIGIERNLAGYPVMKIPSEILDPNATGELAARRTTWQDTVRDARIDEQHGILIPSDVDPETQTPLFEFKLLSSDARPTDTSPIITRYSREILQSVLADVVMIGHEQIGSFALASEKTELFIFGVASILDAIAEPFNNKLIPKLLELNGMDTELAPRLTFGDIEKQDILRFAETLERLVKVGFPSPNDEKSVRFIRELIGLPDPSQEQAEGATNPAEEEPEPEPEPTEDA